VIERAVAEQAIRPGMLTLGTGNGSAFTARATRLVPSALGVAQRRGGYRDPESQAFIESWFRYLEERCVWRHEFETLDQAREVIAAYIDHYHHRPHKAPLRRGFRFPDLQRNSVKCPPYVSGSACDLRRAAPIRTRLSVDRARGPFWSAKYRLPDARQVQKKLGPAWTRRGRPPAGYFTKRLADDWLRTVLDAARQGTLPGMVRAGGTFADACAEFLRYAEHDRGCKPSTLRDYRSNLSAYLLPAFVEESLESITPAAIDRWRGSITGLSNRRKDKLLVVMHGVFRRARHVWGRRRIRSRGAFSIKSGHQATGKQRLRIVRISDWVSECRPPSRLSAF
jgi:hypothetical protein